MELVDCFVEGAIYLDFLDVPGELWLGGRDSRQRGRRARRARRKTRLDENGKYQREGSMSY